MRSRPDRSVGALRRKALPRAADPIDRGVAADGRLGAAQDRAASRRRIGWRRRKACGGQCAPAAFWCMAVTTGARCPRGASPLRSTPALPSAPPITPPRAAASSRSIACSSADRPRPRARYRHRHRHPRHRRRQGAQRTCDCERHGSGRRRRRCRKCFEERRSIARPRDRRP